MTRTRLAALSAHTFALAAVSSLRPLHCVDTAPPKIHGLSIDREGTEVGAGIVHAQKIGGQSPAIVEDGKKAMFSDGHAGASGTKEGGGKKAQFGIGHASASSGTYGGVQRSKKAGIDSTAPLAPLAMAHATAMKVHFGAGLRAS